MSHTYDLRNMARVNELTKRREQLGMSDYDIAARSGVSQPTVHRILSGKHTNASLENVAAVAETLGMTVSLVPTSSIENLRDEQAEKKAIKIAASAQATSALEGQGLEYEIQTTIKNHAKQKLLAGPAKDLWSE